MTMRKTAAASTKQDGGQRVVVSCVTFETAKVVDPIVFYDAHRVHLINYVKDENDPDLRVYTDFCQEVIKQLQERLGMEGANIIVHRRPVYDFTSMMEVMHSILRQEAKGEDVAEVLVNVSAGTSEYTAAATIASMMVPGVKPFTVSTRKYFVPPEKLRVIYYDQGRPIGMSKEVRDPTPLSIYPIEEPPEDLVRGLRVLQEMKEMKVRTSHKNVIRELMARGLWNYQHQPRKGGVSDRGLKEQSITMHYRRHFLEKWVERGWVVNRDRGHDITESGLRVIETFFKD